MEFHSCPSYSDSKFDSIFFCLLLDVYDDVEYLSSLGKAQTANVKRDAAVGVAQANRDAGIRVRNTEIKMKRTNNCRTISYNLFYKCRHQQQVLKVKKKVTQTPGAPFSVFFPIVVN